MRRATERVLTGQYAVLVAKEKSARKSEGKGDDGRERNKTELEVRSHCQEWGNWGNHITFPDRPLEQTPRWLHDGQIQHTGLVDAEKGRQGTGVFSFWACRGDGCKPRSKIAGP